MFTLQFCLILACLWAKCFSSYSRPLEHVIEDIDKLENKPFMSAVETSVLADVLCAHQLDTVIEFGTGGSTLVSALCNVGTLYSVDSSLDWLENLANSNVWATSRTKWFRFHANIGPLLDFGHPEQKQHPGFDFYSRIYDVIPNTPADVVFVDGRFRVACALRSLRFMGPESLLVIHDYERKHYHIIEEFYEKEKQLNRIATFRRKEIINLTRWHEVLEIFKEKTA